MIVVEKSSVLVSESVHKTEQILHFRMNFILMLLVTNNEVEDQCKSLNS